MSPFEIGMLVCFGVSWPVSIAKSLRTRNVAGKSPVFLAIIVLGYVCGIAHKIFYNYDWIAHKIFYNYDRVVWLYALNLAMVSFDLFLYFRFSKKSRE